MLTKSVKKSLINYYKTDYFSALINDFIKRSDKLNNLFNYNSELFDLEFIKNNVKIKKTDRSVLISELKKQYSGIKCNDHIIKNINELKIEKSLTITAAHQPCLFLGPLYIIYKIISVIRLSLDLKKQFSDYNFIPVFWLGSEDHDFEEINHVHLYGKKISWNLEEKNGPVGHLNLETLQPVIDELKTILGESENAKKIVQIIRECYRRDNTLSGATREFLNELFGKYGLLVVDGDSLGLKKQFAQIMLEDTIQQKSYSIVSQVIEKTKDIYAAQVNPREVNLFYIKDQLRSRLVKEEGIYKVLDTDISFTEKELANEINTHPDYFSPNVILRPLYQEAILPGLAFIGGPGEVAYWLQIKAVFDFYKINFPAILLRSCALWIDEQSCNRLNKLNIDVKDVFKPTDKLIKEYILKNSECSVSLTKEKDQLEKIFKEVSVKAVKINKGLAKTVEAEKTRQLKSLNELENKLLREEKKNHEVAGNQISKLKEKLFPKSGLQERYENFLPYYVKYGDAWLDILLQELNPAERQFTILSQDV